MAFQNTFPFFYAGAGQLVCRLPGKSLKNRKSKGNPSPGFTVLEVLVALFIFSLTLTAVMQLMLTGDRINARRVGISSATMLASNQIETIRLQEESSTIMGDSTYEAPLNGIVFEVRRVRKNLSETPRPDTVINYLEFSVMVTRKGDDKPLVNFRLLQGLQELQGLQGSHGAQGPHGK